MTASQTSAGAGSGELPAPAELPEPSFAELMRRPGATLDNLGAGVDWDGARCDECRAPLPDDDVDVCADCAPPEECAGCDHARVFHLDDGPCLGHCDCNGFELPDDPRTDLR